MKQFFIQILEFNAGHNYETLVLKPAISELKKQPRNANSLLFRELECGRSKPLPTNARWLKTAHAKCVDLHESASSEAKAERIKEIPRA